MSDDIMIRVLIADDHPIVRDGLRLVLGRRSDIEVVAEAADGREAVTKALHCRPDVALVDLDMPELNGIAVIKELRRALPECRCVVLTLHEDDAHLFAALDGGAHGFLVKGANSNDIERAVRSAASGQMVLAGEVATGGDRPNSRRPPGTRGRPWNPVIIATQSGRRHASWQGCRSQLGWAPRPKLRHAEGHHRQGCSGWRTHLH